MLAPCFAVRGEVNTVNLHVCSIDLYLYIYMQIDVLRVLNRTIFRKRPNEFAVKFEYVSYKTKSLGEGGQKFVVFPYRVTFIINRVCLIEFSRRIAVEAVDS